MREDVERRKDKRSFGAKNVEQQLCVANKEGREGISKIHQPRCRMRTKIVNKCEDK